MHVGWHVEYVTNVTKYNIIRIIFTQANDNSLILRIIASMPQKLSIVKF